MFSRGDRGDGVRWGGGIKLIGYNLRFHSIPNTGPEMSQQLLIARNCVETYVPLGVNFMTRLLFI